MPIRPVPQRHWALLWHRATARRGGGAGSATCELRQGDEAHTGQRRATLELRTLIARMRHEGCGGGAGKVELLTGIDGVSSRPVRRIVLRGG